MNRLLAPAAGLILALAVAACSEEPDLVVYVSLDQGYSEPILDLFEDRTGLRVEPKFDVEANKTIGLVQAIISEAGRPRADVFWNNEISQTIRLKDLGHTQPYASPSAQGIPAQFRDEEGHWTGFAARARVIMFRRDLLPEGAGPPKRVQDLLLPSMAGHGGMAKPLTGTTLTHFAALCARNGVDPTLTWLRNAKASALHLGPGNAHVMRRVCEGDFGWCLTDTDDAAAGRRNGYPVEILYPDQQPGGAGTLLIPNTVAILKGAPHLENAKKFLDFVLSAEVEELLARSGSDQIPLREGVPAPDHVRLPFRDFRVMEVDWEAVAQQVGARRPDFVQIFTE